MEIADIRERASLVVDAVAAAAEAAIREARGEQRIPEADRRERPRVYDQVADRLAEEGASAIACDKTGTLRKHADAVLAMLLLGVFHPSFGEDGKTGHGHLYISHQAMPLLAFSAKLAVEALWPPGEEGEALQSAIDRL